MNLSDLFDLAQHYADLSPEARRVLDEYSPSALAEGAETPAQRDALDWLGKAGEAGAVNALGIPLAVIVPREEKS